jgi:hypothetical protein
VNSNSKLQIYITAACFWQQKIPENQISINAIHFYTKNPKKSNFYHYYTFLHEKNPKKFKIHSKSQPNQISKQQNINTKLAKPQLNKK